MFFVIDEPSNSELYAPRNSSCVMVGAGTIGLQAKGEGLFDEALAIFEAFRHFLSGFGKHGLIDQSSMVFISRLDRSKTCWRLAGNDLRCKLCRILPDLGVRDH